MATIRKPVPNNSPKPNNNERVNLTLGPKLSSRAIAYSEKSGIKITALLRNGLDLLLKQNNF